MKRLHKSIFLILLVLILLPAAALAKDVRTKEERYEDALRLVEDNSFSEAATAFDKLKGFEESASYAAYARALQAYAMADYDNALAGFTALGSFEYSAEYAAVIPQMDRVFVKRGDHYAMVDTKGNLISDTPWDYTFGMSYGGQRPNRVLYAVYLGDVSMDENSKILTSDDGKWGLVDGNGQIVLAPEWDGIYAFGDTSALMKKDGKRYVVSYADGKIVSEGFDSSNVTYNYHADGRYSVTLGDKAYIVDAAGNAIALPEDVANATQPQMHKEVLRRQEAAYTEQLIGYFSHDGLLGFLNQAGEIVIPAKYSGGAYMNEDGCYEVEIDGLSGFIAADGSYTSEPQYKHIEALFGSDGASGTYIVETDEGCHLIDKDGKTIGKTYDSIETNSYNTVLTYEQNGKFGLMDRSGAVLAKASYDKIYDFRANGLAIFTKGEKQGLISAAGKVVLKEDNYKFSSVAAGCYYIRASSSGALKYTLVTADGKLQKNTVMYAYFDSGSDSMIWTSGSSSGMMRIIWGANSKSPELDTACYLTYNGAQCGFAVTADTRMPQNLSEWGGKDSVTDVARPDNFAELNKYDLPRLGICVRPFIMGEDLTGDEYVPDTDMDGYSGFYLSLEDESESIYMPEIRNKGTLSIKTYAHDDDSETLADIKANDDIIPSYMTGGTSGTQLSRPYAQLTEHYYRLPDGEIIYAVTQSVSASALKLLGGYAGSSISSTYYVLYNTHNGFCYTLDMFSNDGDSPTIDDFMPVLATIETYAPAVRHPALALEKKQQLTFTELGFSIQASAGTRMTWYGESVTPEQAKYGYVLERKATYKTENGSVSGFFGVSVFTGRSAEELAGADAKTYKSGKLTFYTNSRNYFIDVPN